MLEAIIRIKVHNPVKNVYSISISPIQYML